MAPPPVTFPGGLILVDATIINREEIARLMFERQSVLLCDLFRETKTAAQEAAEAVEAIGEILKQMCERGAIPIPTDNRRAWRRAVGRGWRSELRRFARDFARVAHSA